MAFILVDEVRNPSRQEEIEIDSLEDRRTYELACLSKDGQVTWISFPTGRFISDNYGTCSDVIFRVQEIGESK